MTTNNIKFTVSNDDYSTVSESKKAHYINKERNKIKAMFSTLDYLSIYGNLACDMKELIGETILKRYCNTDYFEYALDKYLYYCVPVTDAGLFEKSIRQDIKLGKFLNFD